MEEEWLEEAPKKSILKICLTVSGILAALVLAFFGATKWLVVREVITENATLYTAEEILSVCAIEEGTPLVSLPVGEISERISKSFPYLIHIEIKRHLSGRVSVEYEESFGEVYLKLGDDYFVVDRELNVLIKEKKPAVSDRILLVASDISESVVGKKLSFFDENREESLETVLKNLFEADMLNSVISLDVRDKFQITANFEDRFEILLGDSSEMSLKLAMIREVMEDLGPEKKGKIDISDANTAYMKLVE